MKERAVSSMKERAVSSGVRALGLLGAPWWETAGVWLEASESSVRSRWAGRLCRATLEGSIKWAAVGHRGGRVGGH